MTGSRSRHSYSVQGMACGHCADAITEEIERIDGVVAVQVDVESGMVTVTAARGLALDEIRAAVDEAGYELTDQRA